jgi:hypothetical protein
MVLKERITERIEEIDREEFALGEQLSLARFFWENFPKESPEKEVRRREYKEIKKKVALEQNWHREEMNFLDNELALLLSGETSFGTVSRLQWLQQNNTSSKPLLKKIGKRCPKCGIYISKDGGCNHMKCSMCSYEFCWVCLRALSTHGSDSECAKHAQLLLQVSQTNPSVEDNSDRELSLDDTKFYPSPLTFHEVKTCEIFGRCFEQHTAQIALREVDRLAIEKNEERICKILCWEMSKKDARKLLDRAKRAQVLAREVLIWSYPYAYFLATNGGQLGKFQSWIQRVLEKNMTNVIDFYCDPMDTPASESRISKFGDIVQAVEDWTGKILQVEEGAFF